MPRPWGHLRCGQRARSGRAPRASLGIFQKGLAISDQNLEVARGVYDGWVNGDVTRALKYFDPEVVWEAIADAPDAGTYRGYAGVRRYMEDWLEDFDILSMDFEEVIDADDRLVVLQCGRATGKGSGVETELRYAAAYRFRSGRIVEIKEFRTKDEAIEAAGLSEQEAESRRSP